MSGFFDSGFYDGAQRIAVFTLANLMTAFLLMTVFGAPFGLLGLFAVMNRWTQGGQPELFGLYFGAIRRHWRFCLALGAVDLVLGGLIILNFSLFPAMGQGALTVVSLSMTFFVSSLLLMVNMHGWTIVSLMDLRVRGALKLALYLTLSRPFRSFLAALAMLLPLVASLMLPIAFLLLGALSLSAYIGARGVWWVLRAQFTREELAELLAEREE